MDKALLKKIIIDQRDSLSPTATTAREIEPQLPSYLNNDLIIIITGIRRCGKSVLLQHIRAQQNERDYYVNFDDDRLVNFQLNDFQMLFELLVEMFGTQKTFYFDEIQNIEGWERFVRRLHDHGNKIFITGSNAQLFSQELGSRLTGRHLLITLYPFSFREYLYFKQSTLLNKKLLTSTDRGEMKRLFQQYFEEGGFPKYLQLLEKEYLASLYENILYKDIIVRYQIKNEQSIKKLTHFIASHVGKNFTYNAVKSLISLSSTNTVINYCDYLTNSYLCFFINNYDHSLKNQTLKKIYFIDNALANTIGFRISEDRGHFLENIVFLELKRRYKNIFFHTGKNECDFLIQENHRITLAIQVTTHLNHPSTKKREYAGLLEAMDTHHLQEGLLLTEDEEGEEIFDNSSQKITIMPIWMWLLQAPKNYPHTINHF